MSLTQPGFEIRVDPEGVLWLSGELDLAQAEAFTRAAVACLDEQRDVVLDCSGLTFLDSSGIRAIFQVASWTGGRVVVRNPTESVRKVLSITGIEGQMGLSVEPPN